MNRICILVIVVATWMVSTSVMAQGQKKFEIRTPMIQLQYPKWSITQNLRIGFAGWYVRPNLKVEQKPALIAGGFLVEQVRGDTLIRWLEVMMGTRMDGKGGEDFAINIRNYNVVGDFGIYEEAVIIPENVLIFPFTMTRNFELKPLSFGVGIDGEWTSVAPDRLWEFDGRAGPVIEVNAFGFRFAATYMFGKPNNILRFYFKGRIKPKCK